MLSSVLCLCGCGQYTSIATYSDKRNGQLKGEPVRFVSGHNGRKYPCGLVLEDRWYKTPCLIWQGAKTSDGYGNMWHEGRAVVAHHVVYEKANGPIPEGMEPDHLCRVRSRCKLTHLELVTHQVNVQRGSVSRLNPSIVREIDGEVKKGRSQQKIASDYKVSQGTVSLIKHRKIWANVLDGNMPDPVEGGI